MKTFIKRFFHDTEGQDLIEYALLAGLLALATTAVLMSVGTAINTEMNNISTQIAS